MLDSDLPLCNIKHENVLPHECTPQQDFIPLFRISSETKAGNRAAIQVLARKPVVIKQAPICPLHLKLQYRV